MDNRRSVTVSFAAALALLIAAPALAQPEYPPIRNPYLTVTYGSASREQDAHQQGHFQLYNEETAFDIAHDLDRAAFIDVGAGARVWRGLFVGGAFTARRNERFTGAITAFIPHPVFYDSFRSAEGALSGLEHSEKAFHIQAMWRFEPTRSLQVGFFGGPTLINVSHSLVEDFVVEETGGSFAQVSLGEATHIRRSEGVFGAHGGVEVMYRLVGHLGAGAMVRYSRASVTFQIPENPRLELTVGGLDAGIRIRVGF